MDYTSPDSDGGRIVSVGCEFVGVFWLVPLYDIWDKDCH